MRQKAHFYFIFQSSTNNSFIRNGAFKTASIHISSGNDNTLIIGYRQGSLNGITSNPVVRIVVVGQPGKRRKN